MTLEDIARLCPAPEGWGNWYPEMDLFDTCVVGYVVEAKDGAAQVRIKDISSSGNAWNVSTFIRYKSSSSWVVETDADLPSAYLRALSAVGLAPDPEVEAMRAEVAELRRRLTWSEEMPTEAGDYLVRWTETRGRPVVWTFDAGVWYGPSGTVCRPPPLGSSFLSVADLKEIR